MGTMELIEIAREVLSQITDASPDGMVTADVFYDKLQEKIGCLDNDIKSLLECNLRNTEIDGELFYIKEILHRLDTKGSNDATLEAFNKNRVINPNNKLKI